jgi:hypothetical protein
VHTEQTELLVAWYVPAKQSDSGDIVGPCCALYVYQLRRPAQVLAYNDQQSNPRARVFEIDIHTLKNFAFQD